jgi:hypothetical protein
LDSVGSGAGVAGGGIIVDDNGKLGFCCNGGDDGMPFTDADVIFETY